MENQSGNADPSLLMLRQCLISTFSEIRNIYVESYSAETFTEDQKMIDALLETREISPSLLRVMYGMTPAQLGRLDETMEQAVFGLLTPDQLCRLDEVMGQRQLRGLSSAQRHQLDEIIKYKVFHGLSSEKLRRIDEVMAQLGFAGLSQKQIWQLDEVVGPKYRDSPTTKERLSHRTFNRKIQRCILPRDPGVVRIRGTVLSRTVRGREDTREGARDPSGNRNSSRGEDSAEKGGIASCLIRCDRILDQGWIFVFGRDLQITA